MTIASARRRLAVFLAFLWPDKAACTAIRAIRESKRFDGAFYRASNPRLRWIFRLAPLRHYVTIGESRGLCPAPWFSPVAYCRDHATHTASPFLDHLRHGAPLSVSQFDETPDLASWTGGRARAPHAIVLHLYYPDLWPEIESVLNDAGIDFDLYASLSGAAAAPGGVGADILEAFPDARIVTLPNKGRDMLPFVLAAGSGILAPYRAVAKIHGKLSPHLADGGRWRRRLIGGLFPPDCAERLAVFGTLADARIWAADGATLRGENGWGSNRKRAGEIYDRGRPTELAFPAGGMFWAKPAVLSRLADLGLDLPDFEAEAGFVDGTTAHAVERLIGILALEAGGRIVETRDLGVQAASDGASAANRTAAADWSLTG